VFVILQLGMWMMAGDDFPLPGQRQMKLAALGPGDQREDPDDVAQSLGVVANDDPVNPL
jgi:hypothetical protein